MSMPAFITSIYGRAILALKDRYSAKRVVILLIATVIPLLVYVQLTLLTSSETLEIVHTKIDGFMENLKLPEVLTGGNEKPELTNDDLLALPLGERLEIAFPYHVTTEPLDKNIIQSAKIRRTENLGNDGKTWLSNTDFIHTLFDDGMIKDLLKDYFNETFPEIVQTFDILPRNILRFDFFRYIATFLLGGTYTDSDTRQSKPLSEWITYNETIYGGPNIVGMVAGIEGECDCMTWPGIFSRRVQFCQWTFQAKKHHPLLRILITMIVENTKTRYNPETKVWKSVNGQEYDFSKGSQNFYDGVLELSGPGAFTDAVYTYLNSLESPTIINPNNQPGIYARLRVPKPADNTWGYETDAVKNIGWENVTNIDQPLLVGDMLILPKVYFNGDPEKSNLNLVQHRYHGSWKSSNLD